MPQKICYSNQSTVNVNPRYHCSWLSCFICCVFPKAFIWRCRARFLLCHSMGLHIFEGWYVVWEGSHDINVEFKELASSCQLLILYTQKAMLFFLIKSCFRIRFFICLHGICCLLILLAYLPSLPGHLGTCSQLGGVIPNSARFRVSLCFREK